LSSRTYILWDWNGTLLDDVDAQIATLNAMLSKRGFPTVTRDFFRENFAFPARKFYRLVGMDVPDDEWDALAKEYHDTYHLQSYALNRGAFAALELVKRKGVGQSVISALHQFYLDLETQCYDVQPYMEHIYGVDNLDGGSKLSRAKELLRTLNPQLSTLNPQPSFVLIGDSIHDFEVAQELGIKSVLFSGGSHARDRLTKFSLVGDSLTECVKLAFTLSEA